MKIRFLVNDNGEIETVAVPIEPEVDDILFTRKFAALGMFQMNFAVRWEREGGLSPSQIIFFPLWKSSCSSRAGKKGNLGGLPPSKPPKIVKLKPQVLKHALTEDILKALAGTYQTPIEGLALTISAHNDKVYAMLTGGSPEEIKLYRYDQEAVGFRMKRDHLDFVRENGTITRLIFKSPDLTLEAPKQR